MGNKKYLIGLLAVSAAFFTGLMQYEGFRAKPYRDTGGVPTIGIGSTQYEDGTRVKMTDAPINKARAVEIARVHVSKDEAAFRQSLQGVALSQTEYDLYLDFVYQFGQGAWSRSSMRRLLMQGKHRQACDALLKWKYAGGKDCSVRSNGCYGVWTRQLARYQQCVGVN
ncbi:MAG: lysozyme [Neisseria sp.]|nr:lysozyme [Neisseria sp.]